MAFAFPSLAPFPSFDHACERAFEPSSTGAPSFPMNGRRPAPLLLRRRTVATPSYCAGCSRERIFMLHPLLDEPRATPRRVAVPRAERRTVPRETVDRPSCCGVLEQGSGEEVVAVRTPALRSSPRPSTAAGARRWSSFVLACRGAVRCSPRRACLRAGLRAELFLFLLVLVHAVAT
jgi:hypothetical protein